MLKKCSEAPLTFAQKHIIMSGSSMSSGSFSRKHNSGFRCTQSVGCGGEAVSWLMDAVLGRWLQENNEHN